MRRDRAAGARSALAVLALLGAPACRGPAPAVERVGSAAPAPPAATAPEGTPSPDDEALALLRALGGEPRRVRLGDVDGWSVTVPAEGWRASVDDLQRRLGLEHVAFATFERPEAEPTITIARVADAFDVLALAGASAPSRGLTNDDVLAHVAAWDFAFGVVVKGAGPRWIALKPVQRAGDWRALAEEVATLCPLPAGGLDALAARLERDDVIECWLE